MMSSTDTPAAPDFETLDAAYEWLNSHINYERQLHRIRSADEAFLLEPFGRLLTQLGSPHRGIPSVHIAGTRGKGSSALFLESLLTASGLRVATFMSPHIHEYRERIRIAGQPVAPDVFIACLQRAASLHNETGPLTHSFKTVFELLTAVFFLAAQASAVDFMVVETGLGGRLDCTNVLDPGPVLLTKIGLEHTHILGDTIEAIAGEKAAILKAGGWGVSARQSDPTAERVFAARASSVGAPLAAAQSLTPCVSSRFTPDGMVLDFDLPRGRLHLDLPLFGPFLVENLEGALAIHHELSARQQVPACDPEVLQQSLHRIRLPGRMEKVLHLPERDISLFVDGAHCPTGAGAVVHALAEHFSAGPSTAVLTMMKDKDHERFLDAMAAWPHWKRILCCGLPEMPRSVQPEVLAAYAKSRFPDVLVCPDPQSGLHLAVENAEKGEKIVALGSIFSIGPVSDWSCSYGRT